ncbi:MAG: MFS transporter [Gemmatimonadetes bacterium]|nr:MFS transporter [Gemmatimonadota bacterium]
MTDRAPLAPTVRVLATVSFLTDVASEMIYPLLPLFLSTVLGATAAGLGVIEGVAESVSALLRLPSGWWSDRIGRRKPLVVLGYGLAAVARPLLGLAQSTGQVLAIRVTDRFGKGVRSAPRDALIADAVAPEHRGFAYGLHRAADSAGAVVGPLVAWALLHFGWVELRTLFLWAAVPGLLAWVMVVWWVQESPTGGRVRVAATPNGASLTSHAASPLVGTTSTGAGRALLERVDGTLGPVFWRFLGVLFLFTLAASSDAFLLLRASSLGVSVSQIPILWALLHVVKSGTNIPGGRLSDRIGRRPLILGGWAVYALTYLGFGLATAAWQIWALFLVYGLYFGATEGVEKALVADLVPEDRRGVAFGWFNAALGVGALPASIGFGIVWEQFGASTAFCAAAGLAGAATVLLAVAVPATIQQQREPGRS